MHVSDIFPQHRSQAFIFLRLQLKVMSMRLREDLPMKFHHVNMLNAE